MRCLLLVVVIVSACGDKVLERRVVKTWQENGITDCTYSCMQYTCQPDLNLDIHCGIHLDSCNGEQWAVLQFQQVETIYETDVGGTEKGHRREMTVEKNIVKPLESCR